LNRIYRDHNGNFASDNSLKMINPYVTRTTMTYPSTVSDESVLKKWMAFEMGKINDGVVAERKRLSELLRNDCPSSITRGGKEYIFDSGIIRLLGEKLPEKLHSRLKLPIVFYFDSGVADSCLLTDEAAFEVLQVLGELSRQREFIGGRLWIGRAIVFALLRKYPTIIQIMMQ
jgi:uncharacterized protein (UPF0216 family)